VPSPLGRSRTSWSSPSRQAAPPGTNHQDLARLNPDGISDYSLCIGTFGSIPVDCEFVRPGREGCNGSGSPSPGSEIHSTGLASTAASRGSRHGEFDMHKREECSEEKENETCSVSAFCCSSLSKQVDSRDVEANPGELWSNQEGQKNCLSFDGSKSSSIAVGEDSRVVSISDLRQGSKVNESADSMAPATATSSGSAGSSSSSPSCTMADEVESFYQQLWHIPWNLDRGCPRTTSIKHPRAAVPRVPRLPPPLLPQERAGLCCLGVEEEGFIEEPVMAERGRGRGRGGAGRGDWQANQQQPPPQQPMFDFNQMQQPFPFPPQAYGFMPGGMPPPPWGFGGPFPPYPPSSVWGPE
jgi:hypothetical protein